MAKKLTFFILLAMVTGTFFGFLLNRLIADPATLEGITSHLGIITDLFLRLIKMIIAPLVFATLVSGIAHMGDSAALGRIGVRSIGWFLCASLVSLTLGLILVNLLQPGVGAFSGDALTKAAAAPRVVESASFTLKDFVTHLVPRSIVEAMADNEILQIVVLRSSSAWR